MSKTRVLGFVLLAPTLALLSSLPFLQSGCAPVRTPDGEVPYIRAGSLVGNAEYATRRQHLMIGAILGGIVSVRLMDIFGKRKYGKEEEVLTEGGEGYDLLRFRQVREGSAPERGRGGGFLAGLPALMRSRSN